MEEHSKVNAKDFWENDMKKLQNNARKTKKVKEDSEIKAKDVWKNNIEKLENNASKIKKWEEHFMEQESNLTKSDSQETKFKKLFFFFHNQTLKHSRESSQTNTENEMLTVPNSNDNKKL